MELVSRGPKHSDFPELLETLDLVLCLDIGVSDSRTWFILVHSEGCHVALTGLEAAMELE